MKAILKCGERIRTDREGVWGLPQYGKIEFPISESLEILFAASYDSFAMHTGILLRNRKQGIRHELPYVKGGYRTTYSNLLIHMIERRNVVIERRNVVRVLFEMADDDSKTLEEIGNVDLVNAPDFPKKCVRRLVPLGTIETLKSEHLESAARLIETELEKPLFPLSKANEDTSCLHLSMRLASTLGCMPKWTWLKNKLPDAPVEPHSRL
eukprot:g6582.t1